MARGLKDSPPSPPPADHASDFYRAASGSALPQLSIAECRWSVLGAKQKKKHASVVGRQIQLTMAETCNLKLPISDALSVEHPNRGDATTQKKKHEKV